MNEHTNFPGWLWRLAAEFDAWAKVRSDIVESHILTAISRESDRFRRSLASVTEMDSELAHTASDLEASLPTEPERAECQDEQNYQKALFDRQVARERHPACTKYKEIARGEGRRRATMLRNRLAACDSPVDIATKIAKLARTHAAVLASDADRANRKGLSPVQIHFPDVRQEIVWEILFLPNEVDRHEADRAATGTSQIEDYWADVRAHFGDAPTATPAGTEPAAFGDLRQWIACTSAEKRENMFLCAIDAIQGVAEKRPYRQQLAQYFGLEMTELKKLEEQLARCIAGRGSKRSKLAQRFVTFCNSAEGIQVKRLATHLPFVRQ